MKMLFKINAYNYNLLEARKKTGLSQVQAAKAIGIPTYTLQAFERMTTDFPSMGYVPLYQMVNKVAEFYDVPLEHLFPEEYLDAVVKNKGGWITKWQVVKDMSIQRIADATSSQLLLEESTNPEESTMLSEMQIAVRNAIKSLPEREARVVALHSGIEDGYQYTYSEIAEIMGIKRARAHQIHKQALARLNSRDLYGHAA